MEIEDTQDGKFLTFLIDGESYGLDIRHVTEIIGMHAITRVPDVPSHVHGIVQHMPAGFTSLYADRLNGAIDVRAVEARDGETIMQGTVYVAPGEQQCVVQRSGADFALRVRPGPKVSGHCPSVDVLRGLRDAARGVAPRCRRGAGWASTRWATRSPPGSGGRWRDLRRVAPQARRLPRRAVARASSCVQLALPACVLRSGSCCCAVLVSPNHPLR